MPTVICNTSPCLIPKELFKEEKIQAYWHCLNAPTNDERIGKDELQNFFLLYAKSKNEDTIHEITSMYQNMQEHFQNQKHAICVSENDKGINLFALKDGNMVYAGCFQCTAKEDVLYHLTNMSQQYFEDISSIAFFYQQLSSDTLRFLNQYYEMQKLIDYV